MGFATMGLEAACARGFLAGKTVLLTGPTAGLGAAIVDELCLLGRNKPKKVRAGRQELFRGGGGRAPSHDSDCGQVDVQTPGWGLPEARAWIARALPRPMSALASIRGRHTHATTRVFRTITYSSSQANTLPALASLPGIPHWGLCCCSLEPRAVWVRVNITSRFAFDTARPSLGALVIGMTLGLQLGLSEPRARSSSEPPSAAARRLH